MDIDDNFNGIMAGNISKMPEDSSFVIKSILALNLKLPEEAYARMREVIVGDQSNELADNNSEFVTKAMAEYLNDKDLKKALEMTPSTGEITPSDVLNRNLFISQVNIHYSPIKKQFLCLEPVHIATIDGKQVNRAIASRIAISKRRSTTRYTFYFEVSKYDWFYIDYYMGSVTVASTDKEFNDIIKDKGPKMGEGKFRIRTASPRTVANFLNKLEVED